MPYSNHQVLIADDSKVIRLQIEYVLKEMGFQSILHAEDGQEAWELLQENAPNILLLDWDMPRLSGLELIRKIKADERLRHIPILMISVQGEGRKIMEAVSAGAHGYLVKPVSPMMIKNKIQEILPPNFS